MINRSICSAEYGKFHYFLLAVCGFVSTSEEMDVISMSFILPSAQCDLNLDTQAKGWLNSIIFIGMMAGAYAWGSVADALGRRKVLIAISFMNALCIVASSFSQSYELFMFFRFLNGAAWVLQFSHFKEIFKSPIFNSKRRNLRKNSNMKTAIYYIDEITIADGKIYYINIVSLYLLKTIVIYPLLEHWRSLNFFC